MIFLLQSLIELTIDTMRFRASFCSEIFSYSLALTGDSSIQVCLFFPSSLTNGMFYFSRNLSVQFSSVAQLCPTPCDPMNHTTPGLPVHHQLLEFTQTLVHQVIDAIQPSHPLSSPSQLLMFTLFS